MENNIDELKDVILGEEDEKNVAPQRDAEFGIPSEEDKELIEEKAEEE